MQHIVDAAHRWESVAYGRLLGIDFNRGPRGHRRRNVVADRDRLKAAIREVPDFPKPGIGYKDITTLLKDPALLREALNAFQERWKDERVDIVVGVESRGFIFGAALADRLGVGFAPVRKPGKLPAATYREEYQLEYGTDALEIHRDALVPGSRVLIVDDLLATGGTAAATARLVASVGAEVVGLAFLVNLTFLPGASRLTEYPVQSLVDY
jgi:adenine phosphoribosyltransferase